MRHRIPHRTLLALTSAALASLALAPITAHAGSYQVSSCDYAGGAQNAWTADSNHAKMPAFSACPSNGDWARGIIARNAVPASGSLLVPYSAAARQWFTSPPDTGITNVRFSGQIFRAVGQRWSVGLSNGSQILAGASASNTNGWSWTTTDADVAVPGNRTVYWEAACYETAGCDTKSTGDPASHYVRAAVWVRGTIVTISDPTYPAAGWGGSLTSAGWLRGDQSLSWSASDNSGIANVTATLGGRAIGGGGQACDYTRPTPCPGSASSGASVATAGFPDGAYTLQLDVRDASGNVQPLTRTAYLDNTAPARVSGIGVQGGEGWRAANAFTLTWQNPAGQHAPLTRRHYRVCRPDGSGCVTGSQDGGQNSIALSVPGRGVWRAQVWLQDAAGNVSADNASDPVTLRFDDAIPPRAVVPAPAGWLSAEQAQSYPLALALAAAAPVSGIAGYSVTTDGSDPDATVDTDATWTLTDLPEGTVTLKARAISGAGVPATDIATATLRVDRSTPSADASGAPDPGTWQRAPVTIELHGTDQAALSGIAQLAWRIDGGEDHVATGADTQVTLDWDGRHTLSYEAIDNAGNRSRTRSVTVKIDRTAPERVTFDPPNGDDPRRVAVSVSDSSSGVAGGSIELRADGGEWQPIDTRLDGDRLVAQIDDEHLPDNRYQLRARASDAAGNERIAGHRADGSPATLTLPLRLGSSIRLAAAHASGARRSRTPAAPVRTITGVLTTADGHPIGGAALRVLSRLRTGSEFKAAGRLKTGRHGRFTYTVPQGPSRTIRFRYDGTDTVLPVTAQATILTAASTTIHVSRTVARLGEKVRFTGRLRGGHVPPIGKVLELQAYDQGLWRSFPSTVRTDARGRWTATLRFERTTGTYTYRIRARIRADTGYPFELGYSRTIRLTVRGR